jgi:hypothetical protein
MIGVARYNMSAVESLEVEIQDRISSILFALF